MMSNANRQDARRAGQRFYLPTAPCSHGHMAPRYVSTGHCTECIKDRRQEEQTLAREANRAAMGGSYVFAYALHPDDHAAALAFCQALDLQRGRVPKAQAIDLTAPRAAKFAPQAGASVVLPANIAAARASVEIPPEVLAQHEAIRK